MTNWKNLSADDADKLFRNNLESETRGAPLGQEPAFKQSARIILHYYEHSLTNINNINASDIDKNELRKALAMKYLHIINANSGEVDSLITSEKQITNLYQEQNKSLEK